MVWSAFITASLAAFVFFFFTKRRFDLLTVAYIGAVFYFSPLVWGKVLQSSDAFDSTIPPPVYLIAIVYIVALAAAALLPQRETKLRPGRGLSEWYLILAVAGLAGSLASSRGAIIDADKVKALAQIGYLFTCFEIAASLACVSAAIERRWWILAGGVLLLAIDLLIGFRVYAVLTALSVALVLLMQSGRIRLFTKIPTYGAAAAVLIVGMLFVHTARFAIFDQIAIIENAPRVVRTQDMRSDTLQFERAAEAAIAPIGPGETPKQNESTISKWLQMPFNMLQRSEPVIIQATLAATVQSGLSCSPSNILKSLYLLIPPVMIKLVPNPFPPTFYEEYQPILYPGITYGTGGNIWAEMLCRFGYVGVAIFGALMILALIGASKLLAKASTTTIPPIAFGGCIVAFYINRNDLQVTLVMLRQVAGVFIIAWFLAWLSRLPIRSRSALLNR
ncbi:hypothetical protein [Bradyrhizobium erythrophlei]|uniref:Oligosaccharide repeat unit polymerase n=1 Tax=Bradyrhizobium erythrophlei TaxID=1437360 RepID=A0A1M5V707_9BRAD|nr:hypothetical protein [Bradyrhizobium erythrophlei]SHH71049.1 hypothetical protein SAMN05443248_5806 [Bradyrhizobium erythrophlei]